MKRRKSEKDKALADNSYLLRAWRRWHREQLDQALAGPHGPIVTHVMTFLETMTPASANALLELMRGHTWADVDANTKFVVLHEINDAITRMREKHGLAPIDDPIAPKVNAFIALCQMLHIR
jgi:hypothetical protein